MNNEQHISIKNCDKVNKICQNLNQTFAINYFFYVKKYSNGHRVLLSNHADWLSDYITRVPYEPDLLSFENSDLHEHINLFSWINLQTMPAYAEAKKYFGLTQGVTIIQKYAHMKEFWYFGSNQKRQDYIKFLFSHSNCLKRFGYYFKEQASKLISIAEEQKLILPAKNSQSVVDDIKEADFFEQTKLKRLHVGLKQNEYLTIKEVKCLMLFSLGYSSKEIARKLFISPRTVDTHIANITTKFSVKNIKHLLSLINVDEIMTMVDMPK